jgi:hypothetical protein
MLSSYRDQNNGKWIEVPRAFFQEDNSSMYALKSGMRH